MKRFLSLLVAVAALLFVSGDALATTCTVTNFPTTGTLTASRLNARFNQVESCINGNIDDTNIGTSAAIGITKIANDLARSPVTVQLDCSATQTGAFMTRIPADGRLTDAYVRCVQCSGNDIDVDIQVNAATQISFTGIAGSSLQTDLGNNIIVGSTQDVEVDITVTSAPATCWLDVTLWFTIQHAS